jgi:hypothetical protein
LYPEYLSAEKLRYRCKSLNMLGLPWTAGQGMSRSAEEILVDWLPVGEAFLQAMPEPNLRLAQTPAQEHTLVPAQRDEIHQAQVQ